MLYLIIIISMSYHFSIPYLIIILFYIWLLFYSISSISSYFFLSFIFSLFNSIRHYHSILYLTLILFYILFLFFLTIILFHILSSFPSSASTSTPTSVWRWLSIIFVLSYTHQPTHPPDLEIILCFLVSCDLANKFSAKVQ